jgi:multiple antibiotic resistance protein
MPKPFGIAFLTVLVLLDPIGNIPMFLSLTQRQDERARNRTALVAVIAAAVILGIFAAVGNAILTYLKITIQDLQVAGGILLFVVALPMIGGTNRTPVTDDDNVAVVPIGTPLLAGPGTIVALLVLFDRYNAPEERASILGGIAVALALIYVAFRFASVIGARLKPTLARAITRVVGLLVTAIAVHFIASAVGEWFRNGVR